MEKLNAKKFAMVWQRSRYDAGKTQAYMAKAMNVSLKTVQNWEAGITCPSQQQGFDWFLKLGVQPLPYYLDVLYPNLKQLNDLSPVADIDEALSDVTEQLSMGMKRRLLYILSGLHGSSVAALLELMTVYLALPLHGRIIVTETILSKYELDGVNDDLHRSDVLPDIDLIKSAVSRATEAMHEHRDSYTVLPEMK